MEKKTNSNLLGMSVFGAIFFIFGFATTFIITLSAKVKSVFELSEFEAQLINFAFFISYAIVSIPIGLYIRQIGYKLAVVVGLFFMAIGCFLFYPSAGLPSFQLFLVSTFIIAVGVVFLQTAANPYVTTLGAPNTVSSRLNLMQALNSIATMLAPWIIALFIFKTVANSFDDPTSAKSVQMPFLIMGIAITIIALSILLIKLPEISSEKVNRKSIWKYPHVILGAIAIFFYVGAEVGIGGLIISNFTANHGFIESEASKYAAIYWGGAMIGRFFGSYMFTNIKLNKKLLYTVPVLALAFISGSFITNWNFNIGFIFFTIAIANFIFMLIGRGKTDISLAVFAVIAALLAIYSALNVNSFALWAIVSIGLFNSIMFPNIFTLAVKDLQQAELSTVAGIINTMIAGGAILPLIMGKIADISGSTQMAFIVPAVSYLFIAYYAISGSKLRIKNN